MLFLYIPLFHDFMILLLRWFLFSKTGRRQFHVMRKSVKGFWQRQCGEKCLQQLGNRGIGQRLIGFEAVAL